MFEPSAFAELHARSNFTFLVGASNPEEMVVRAAAKLYSALALTDECSVSGVVRAHLAAREASLHFICGSEVLLTTTQSGHPHARVVFLAQNKLGWGNLCECITARPARRQGLLQRARDRTGQDSMEINRRDPGAEVAASGRCLIAAEIGKLLKKSDDS